MVHASILRSNLFPIIAILVCGLIPENVFRNSTSRVQAGLKSNLFNRADLERIERGYYEQLVEVDRRLDDFADVPTLRLRRVGGYAGALSVDAAPLVKRVDDVREVVLKRAAAVDQGGVHWRTNADGMRDQWYTRAKTPESFRVVLVGDSIGAGWGVNVEDRFESILERAWDNRVKETRGRSVEIVNCAVPGHSPGQRWYHFMQVGWPMHPDLVICESTTADLGWDERPLAISSGAWNRLGLAAISPCAHSCGSQAAVQPGRL